MANANKALKDLIEEGKESGVLSTSSWRPTRHLVALWPRRI